MNLTRLRKAISNLMDATRAECRDGPHAPVEEAQEAVEAAMEELCAGREREYCPICESHNGHSLSCATLNVNGKTIEPSPVQTREDELREALTKVRDAITSEVNSLAIVDTVWMPVPGAAYSIETLCDFIDAALSQPEPKGDKT